MRRTGPKSGHYQDAFNLRMTLRDWRQALNSSPGYRISNNSIRFQTKFVTLITTVGLVALFLYSYHVHKNQNSLNGLASFEHSLIYNRTYPLTYPKLSQYASEYQIAIVTDLDTLSKVEGKDSWRSYFLKGTLVWNKVTTKVDVHWSETPTVLTSGYAMNGRGMELSELVVFNGKLLSFDDRTGIIYEVSDDKAIPWVLLNDGNGRVTKGFKSEWATVKDDYLYVGSMGKEWTSPNGIYINHNPMWVKMISMHGEVRHLDWKNNYIKLRKAVDIEFPGYVIHESAVWSCIHKKWFFLPRRSSRSSYNETLDELRGANILMMADELFEEITVREVGPLIPVRGFSSFKFIPFSDDSVIVALKTEEFNGSLATFITAFTIEGHILLPDTKVSDIKYEGIEFI